MAKPKRTIKLYKDYGAVPDDSIELVAEYNYLNKPVLSITFGEHYVELSQEEAERLVAEIQKVDWEAIEKAGKEAEAKRQERLKKNAS